MLLTNLIEKVIEAQKIHQRPDTAVSLMYTVMKINDDDVVAQHMCRIAPTLAPGKA